MAAKINGSSCNIKKHELQNSEDGEVHVFSSSAEYHSSWDPAMMVIQWTYADTAAICDVYGKVLVCLLDAELPVMNKEWEFKILRSLGPGNFTKFEICDFCILCHLIGQKITFKHPKGSKYNQFRSPMKSPSSKSRERNSSQCFG
ncbi:hypothetical protein Leryth_021430 [Lithospermum erythrorhizon]|nr:hypothetical protein Leryth_021430 [Lithospermum erythrorhizon]